MHGPDMLKLELSPVNASLYGCVACSRYTGAIFSGG